MTRVTTRSGAMNSRSTFATTVITILLLVCGCNTQTDVPSNKTLLVLYAFSAEGEVLKEQLQDLKVDTQLSRDVYIGSIVGKPVVVAQSGVGMVNAAFNLQRLIDIYQPSSVIMTGIAGAVDTSVRIGDIVVPEKWITHDHGYFGPEGFEISPIYLVDPASDTMMYKDSFGVDSILLEAVSRISKDSIMMEQIDDRRPVLMVGGVGVSGDAFIDNRSKREWLSYACNALVTDKESSAVAQVCFVNDIPFVVFRSASDLAGGSDSESAREEMRQFFSVAASNSSMLVIEFLKQL